MARLTPAHLHGLAAVLGALGAGNSRSASARPGNQTLAGAGGRIAWGGQTFQNPTDLVAWMNARGQHTTLAQFLGRHPGVAAEYGQRGVAAGGRGPLPQVTSGDTFGVAPLPRTSGGPPGQFGPPAFQGGPAGIGPVSIRGQVNPPGRIPLPPSGRPPLPPGSVGFQGASSGYPTSGLLNGLPQSLGVRRRQARQPLMAALLNR